ncbi:hypothetical protein HPP92_026093 [Vanilla planifolia]|uniref:Uncharacterized protein n=1 Tax=Vanilla planifolia TaxID=51239 RepID=A0A835U6S8_VANPL|nr:hypothetical protein HPP92_026093 [Vanilla planifolia]
MKQQIAAMTIIVVISAAQAGRVLCEDEAMAAESPETSTLCVSKCGTCPVVCSPTPPPPPLPPPPKASINVVPSPPTRKQLPPPSPPSPPWSFTSSPSSGGQDRGGFSYPYYYFYTSNASRAHGLHLVSLWTFSLLVVLLSQLPEARR